MMSGSLIDITSDLILQPYISRCSGFPVKKICKKQQSKIILQSFLYRSSKIQYSVEDEISCKFKVSTFCYKNIPEINNPTALNISTMFILCSLNVNIFQTVTKDISNASNNHETYNTFCKILNYFYIEGSSREIKVNRNWLILSVLL